MSVTPRGLHQRPELQNRLWFGLSVLGMSVTSRFAEHKPPGHFRVHAGQLGLWPVRMRCSSAWYCRGVLAEEAAAHSAGLDLTCILERKVQGLWWMPASALYV